MTVRHRQTGYELYAKLPEEFFSAILLLPLTEKRRRVLRAIASGHQTRLGLTWADTEDSDEIDVATFAAGVALWRAAACGRTTILWGGRRSIAWEWIMLAAEVVSKAQPEFRSDFRVEMMTGRGREPTPPWRLQMPNGAAALRYDGALPEDISRGVDEHGGRADVLIGDFGWASSEHIAEALRVVECDALVSLVDLPHVAPA